MNGGGGVGDFDEESKRATCSSVVLVYAYRYWGVELMGGGITLCEFIVFIFCFFLVDTAALFSFSCLPRGAVRWIGA